MILSRYDVNYMPYVRNYVSCMDELAASIEEEIKQMNGGGAFVSESALLRYLEYGKNSKDALAEIPHYVSGSGRRRYRAAEVAAWIVKKRRGTAVDMKSAPVRATGRVTT